jgi:outer membrane protein
MKMLYIFFTLTTFLAHGSDPVQIGVGTGGRTSIFKEHESYPYILPSIYLDSEFYFLKGLTAGIKLYKSYPLINFILTPQMMQIDSSDGTYNEGLHKRRRTLHAGLQLIVPNELATIKLQLEQDILGRHKGQKLGLELRKPFPLEVISLTITPGVFADYYSEKYTTYYYGISAQEARSNRAAYSPNAGIEYGPMLHLHYKLSEERNLSGLVKYSTFNKEITHSPLVQENHQYNWFITISQQF